MHVTDDQQIMVNFVHPTDSTQVLTATVGRTSTPHYLLDQLVRSGFMPQAPSNSSYKLVDPNTHRELGDYQTLAAAGVAPNATLSVMGAYVGARGEGTGRERR